MIRKITLTLLLFLSILSLRSEELLFKNISSFGDHLSSTVRAIYRDCTGFTWFGIDNTLVQFDGIHIFDYPFPTDSENPLYITSIGEVGKEYLLVGTNRGLYRIPDEEGNLRFMRLNEKEIREVTSICTLDSVTATVASNAGITIFSRNEKEPVSVAIDSHAFSSLNKVLAHSFDGKEVFAATGNAVYSINLRNLSKKRIVADKALSDATSLGVTPNAILVGSLTSGLHVYDRKTGKPLPNIEIGCNVVNSLSRAETGNIFVGTDGNGVLELDAKSLECVMHLKKRTSKGGHLSSNQIYSTLVDNEDGIWVGFYQGAADYSLKMGKKFEIVDIPGLLDTHGLTIRAIDFSDRTIMLGSRNGLHLISPDFKSVRQISTPRLRSDMVLEILKHDGLYYIGTYGGGCIVYDPVNDKVSDLTSDPVKPFVKGHIFSIAKDKEGALWFGTSEGVFSFKYGKITRHFNESNSKLPDNNVFEVMFDSSGKGWICTGKGMAIFDPASGSLRTDVFPKNFISRRSIRTIYEDRHHNLYFIPEKGPMTVSDIEMSRFRDVDPALFNNAEIRSLIEDRQGKMWVTTNNGIYRWDKDNEASRFGFADGIVNTAFISGNPVIDDNGVIWTGNPVGLLRFNPAEIGNPTDSRPVSITGVTVDDRFLDKVLFYPDEDGRYRLKLREVPHFIKIDFSDFLYTKSEISNYEYSLDGENWMPVGPDMSFSIYDIKSGDQNIYIRNIHNRDNVTTIELSVPYPAFLKWFAAAVAVAAIGVAGAMMWHRRKRQEEEESEYAGDSFSEEFPAATETDGNDAEAPSSSVGDTSDDASRTDNDGSESTAPSKKKKYSANKFTDTDASEISARLDSIIKKEKPYLNPDLSIADLAGMLEISSHRLSQYFSQYLNQNFYDFINRYRVDEFKRLIKKEDLSRFTLSTLSERAGFSSRASFFRYFKKFEGITPAEYIRSITGQGE